ncbi:MAG: hypothetical protein EOM12_14560 [Verrucomicrobiae bacterium]|nr:hypothetical protein [Verrucomicrobiae bacterium]
MMITDSKTISARLQGKHKLLLSILFFLLGLSFLIWPINVEDIAVAITGGLVLSSFILLSIWWNNKCVWMVGFAIWLYGCIGDIMRFPNNISVDVIAKFQYVVIGWIIMVVIHFAYSKRKK